MIQTTPSLSFTEALSASINKIFIFQGRSRRSEYWWTQLIVYLTLIFLPPIIGCVLSLLTIPLTFRRLHDTGRSGWWWGVGALLKLTFIIFLGYDCIMTINGYDLLTTTLFLKYSIFYIGIGVYQIILIVLCCIDSEQSENIYGASPKYIDDTNMADQTNN